MKHSSLTVALIFGVVASAAFQLLLLMVASRSGGPTTVGSVSLHLATANFLCAVGLSDLKSLSIRRLVEERSLQSLTGLRNLCLVLLLAIAIAASFVPNAQFLADLIIIRACAQAADVNVSIWQKHRQTLPLLVFSSIRYVGVGTLLFTVSEISGRFDIALVAAAVAALMTMLVEQELLRRRYTYTRLSWRPIFDIASLGRNPLVAGYISLSLAAGLNFFPQVILRYQLLQFGSMEMLGHFSVQYQISLLAIPLVTAFSQQVLMRPEIKAQQILKDEIFIMLGSSLLMSMTVLLFLTPASVLVRLVFSDWTPLEILPTLLTATASGLLCICVYLGFMTVALHRMFAQTITGVIFLTILATVGTGFGILWGNVGVLAGFVTAAIARFVALKAFVQFAVRSKRS